MTLKIRRGTDTERQTITPAEGEIIYTTDTKKIYVGDGTTAGGNTVTSESGSVFIDNGNVAIGDNVLDEEATGWNNIAIGSNVLGINTTGSTNTAVGYGVLTFNTAGGDNTAMGDNSMRENTTGSYNAAYGAGSLMSNQTGNNHTALGWWAANSLTTGTTVTAVGAWSLHDLISGNNNVAVGYGSGYHINTGNSNTVVGWSSQENGFSGNNNTSTGHTSLKNCKYSSNNTAVGQAAAENLGKFVTAGNFRVGEVYKIVNTFDTDFTLIGASSNDIGTVFTATGVGTGTGQAAPTAAERHTMVGQNAGRFLETGQRGTFIGRAAGYFIKHSLRSTLLGEGAGYYNYDSQFNTQVGQAAGNHINGQNNVIIGRAAFEQGQQVFAGSLETGKSYMIAGVGNTSWTAIGAANNNEGTVFVATGAGSGTGWAAEIDSAYCNRNVVLGVRAGAGPTVTSGAGVKSNDSIFVGYESKPAAGTDNNCIVIGTSAVGLGSNTTVIGSSTNSITGLYGDVKALSGNVVVSSASQKGIKLNTTTPAWGWRDITAAFTARATGPSVPSYAQYAGTPLYAYQFSNSATQELFIEFHVPHDYVPGSDMHIHTHWSQTTADPGTAVKWSYDVLYAKGHNQAAFPSSVSTVSVTQNASSTVRQHMIAEVQLSSSGQIGGQDLEVDGVVLVRMYRDPADAADTLTVAPFAHFCDIHYQSTNIATAGKAPDFYA